MHESAGSFEFRHPVTWRLVRADTSVGPTSLVVALHGMGENAAVMQRRVAALVEPHRALLLPDAPLPFEERRDDRRREGRAWYVYTGDQDAFLESAGRTERWLLDLIDETLKREAPAARVTLMGFSQGGYLAGIMALRHPERFAAVVAVAARLKAELLDGRPPAPDRPAVLVMHGRDDRFIAPDVARESACALADRGWEVDFRSYETGHRITPEQVEDLRGWLTAREL